MVVEVVVAEVGAVVVAEVEDPDGLVEAPETIDPTPSPSPSVPPTTPSPSRILPKGFFICVLSLLRSGSIASADIVCVVLSTPQ